MKKLILIALILSAGIASAAKAPKELHRESIGNASWTAGRVNDGARFEFGPDGEMMMFFFATKTCTATPCLFSSGTNWNGGTAPVDGDLIVTGANTVTMDRDNAIVGDVAGTGIGVSVSVAAGKFQCAANMHMTFRGTNTTTATFWTTVANSTMDLSNCVSVLYQGASDYAAVAVNNGNYLDSATTVSDAAASTFVWNNAATMTVAGLTATPYDLPNGIYIAKIGADTGSLSNAGPISNAAGTAIGTAADNSVTKVSGGWDGTTFNPKTGCVNGWVDTTVLTTNGDYCVDPFQGVIYYKSSSGVLTVKISYTYGSWFGWGIWSSNNADNSAITLNGPHLHCGSTSITAETSGTCNFIDDKCAPGYVTAPCNATRTVTFGPSFKCEYFSRCVTLTNDHLVPGSDTNHHYSMPTPTFNYAQYPPSGFPIFQNGILQLNNIQYLDVASPILNSYINLFNTTGARGPFDHIIVTNACGGSSIGSILYQVVPAGATASAFKSNYNFTTGVGCANQLSGFNGSDFIGTAGDGSLISEGGAAGAVNVYTDLFVTHTHRAGRLREYMDVERGIFPYNDHHGFIVAQPGYVDCSTITFKNIITYGWQDATNLTGGATSSYNQKAWIDGCSFSNNTFYGSTRSLEFNDAESTVAAVTRYTEYNNIAAGNLDGIYRAPASATSNVINLGICLSDWTNDFSNATNPTNVLQGTFMLSGSGYCNNGAKTALGVYIGNPSYTLPAAAHDLVMAVGSAIPTKTLTVQWGGGTAVNMLQAQGTFTSVSTSATGCPTTACATLTDSGASFPTSSGALGLQAYLGKIESGTGSGQYFMIFSNTGTALSVFAKSATGAFAVTPDNTSKYLIFKPDQRVLDSGAVDGISVQIYPPELTTTNGTYTDANITITKNYPGTSGADNGVNPNFVSVTDFHPKNTALKGTGLGGLDIGALPVQGGSCGLLMLLGVGC